MQTGKPYPPYGNANYAEIQIDILHSLRVRTWYVCRRTNQRQELARP